MRLPMNQNELDFSSFSKLKEGEQFYKEIKIAYKEGTLVSIFSKINTNAGVDVVQVGERDEVEGRLLLYTRPIRFGTKGEFIAWLLKLIGEGFEDIVSLSIQLIEQKAIKMKEREAMEAMYM
jgi:hypothetical protein